MAGKNWQIEGSYVEYCSCKQGCPCETMADPTYGDCTGLVALAHIAWNQNGLLHTYDQYKLKFGRP